MKKLLMAICLPLQGLGRVVSRLSAPAHFHAAGAGHSHTHLQGDDHAHMGVAAIGPRGATKAGMCLSSRITSLSAISAGSSST